MTVDRSAPRHRRRISRESQFGELPGPSNVRIRLRNKLLSAAEDEEVRAVRRERERDSRWLAEARAIFDPSWNAAARPPPFPDGRSSEKYIFP